MKKRLVLLALSLGLALGSLAGCGSKAEEAKPSAKEEISEEKAENESDDSSEKEDEVLLSSEDEAVEASVNTESEVYKALDDILLSIYNIHPGTAGSSLRAESSAEELAGFISEYGDKYDAETFQTLTDEWLSHMYANSALPVAFDINDMAECYGSAESFLNDTHADDIETDTFKNVLDGISNSLAEDWPKI